MEWQCTLPFGSWDAELTFCVIFVHRAALEGLLSDKMQKDWIRVSQDGLDFHASTQVWTFTKILRISQTYQAGP